MDWFTAIVLFIMIWWTVLFAVLPFGTKPIADADEQTGWRGTPERPRMGRKVLVTSLITLVLWGGAMVVIRSDWLSFRDAASQMPDN
jgi:predicted secreted protein